MDLVTNGLACGLKNSFCPTTPKEAVIPELVGASIDDPNIALRLWDRETPVDVRARELPVMINECEALMASAFPSLMNGCTSNGTTASIPSVMNKLVHGNFTSPRIYQDENIHLRTSADPTLQYIFGEAHSSTSLVYGVTFQALTHIRLFEAGFGNNARIELHPEIAAIHRFVADLGSVAMYAKLSRGDSTKLDSYINDFKEGTAYPGTGYQVKDFESTSDDPNQAGRLSLRQVLDSAKKENVDLGKLLPKIFESSMKILQDRGKDKNELQCQGTEINYKFVDFARDLCLQVDGLCINSSLNDHGRGLMIALSEMSGRKYIEVPDIRVRKPQLQASTNLLPAWIEFETANV